MEKFLSHREGNRFLGGDRPSVADVEAWGVVNLTEGTSAFPHYVKNPEFAQWYNSVGHHVNTHQGMESDYPVFATDPKNEEVTQTEPNEVTIVEKPEETTES